MHERTPELSQPLGLRKKKNKKKSKKIIHRK
jgi:hypothetical protein